MTTVNQSAAMPTLAPAAPQCANAGGAVDDVVAETVTAPPASRVLSEKQEATLARGRAKRKRQTDLARKRREMALLELEDDETDSDGDEGSQRRGSLNKSGRSWLWMLLMALLARVVVAIAASTWVAPREFEPGHASPPSLEPGAPAMHAEAMAEPYPSNPVNTSREAVDPVPPPDVSSQQHLESSGLTVGSNLMGQRSVNTHGFGFLDS